MPKKKTHVEIEVIISNKLGLHARPVMRFVDLATQFKSSIRVHKDDIEVDGKSPMEMMLLEAVKGSTLRLVAQGEDAHQATVTLAELINNQFGEE